jgi:putative DNA-invertase from lambdoid prophage Rac
MKAAIYIRVSTSKKAAQADTYQQNPRVQLEPLKKVCLERGWDFTVYEERISGTGKNRPQFNSLMEAARRGEFAAVLVWKFDRFARSLKDLVVALEELNAVDVRLVSFTEAIDTATPSGRALFAMAGVFAEFERSLIKERIAAGLDHARNFGTKSGKAIGRPKKIVRRDEILRMKNAGVPVREICRKFNIGMAALYKACSETRLAETGDTGRIAKGKRIATAAL